MGLTAEVLFVNPDYLKRITNLNGSVEDAYIVPSVIIAQDKYIQQYLGTDLLNALKLTLPLEAFLLIMRIYLTIM